MSLYDTGILMTSGFSIATQKPADLKFLANTIAERDSYITRNLAYEGMIVYVIEDQTTYQLKRNNNWEKFGFNSEEFKKGIVDNLLSDSSDLVLSARQGKVLNVKIDNHINDNQIHMTMSDKEKLNSLSVVEPYEHPETHPASMIEQDETHRFITDEDLNKLNELENYEHADDEYTRHVTDEQIATWNAKASTAVATISTDGLMSAADKVKLDSLENYVHPLDENTRHVTDEQINIWNSKASTAVATTSTDGLMSAADKIKLDTINITDGDIALDDITNQLADINAKIEGLDAINAKLAEIDNINAKIEEINTKLLNAVYFK